MQHINNIKNEDKWIRPWNKKQYNDLINRDDRFFGLIIKGVLAWLNKHIIMYDKPIKHFIFNTGTTYIYMESNGYNYEMKETSGEDWLYMERPRCIIELGDINIDTEELSQPNIRIEYERMSSKDNAIKGYNAEFRRIPVTMQINLKYSLSNFNEQIILIQELLDNMLFQKYFKVVYLGQIIDCSIEMPRNFNIEIGKIDMTSTDPNSNSINLNIILNTNYPAINELTEISNDKVIAEFEGAIKLYKENPDNVTDIEKQKVD